LSREGEIKARLNRLLAGQARPEDVSRLFSWVRDRASDAAIVREDGHFAAHPGIRVKDLVTEEMRSAFAHLRFVIPIISGTPYDFSDLPPDFNNVVTRNLSRTAEAVIIQNLGAPRREAENQLKAALSKFKIKKNGRFTASQIITPQDQAVINLSLQYIISQPLFSEQHLHTEFFGAMRALGLLEPAQSAALRAAGPWLTLYAISAMHQTEIALQRDWKAVLQASIWEGLLAVECATRIEVPNGVSPHFVFQIFSTRMKADDWCDDSMRPFADSDHFSFPIELINGPCLARLS
jgi:hypothetical protein